MRIITADLRRTQGLVDRFASACVGAGRAHELLRAGGRWERPFPMRENGVWRVILTPG